MNVYEKRWSLVAAIYPHMESEDQRSVRESLELPEDILATILESESTSEEVEQFKRDLNGD